MKNKIEKELRFVLTNREYEELKLRVSELKDVITPGHAVKELTVMYDNPNKELTFYSKEVDGRLRVRTSEAGNAELLACNSTSPSVSMLTWKQRIPKHVGKELNQEYETEVAIDATEMISMISILENVLHCPRVSSYERNRETFYMNGVEVASDTFPYGHVVELELKEGEEQALYAVAKELNLHKCWKSTLSCDDMYRTLCKHERKEAKSDILFSDNDMPSLDQYLIKTEMKS